MTLRGWRRRLSLRARLTINYAGIFMITATLLMTAVYVIMRYVPQYQITNADKMSPVEDFEKTGVGGPAEPSQTTRHSGLDIGVSIQSKEDLLTTLLVVFAISLLVIGLLGVWGSWVVAGRVLRPIDRITKAAQTAQQGNLDERIDLDGPEDELKRLADTFDAMLVRLEADFHAHQRFAANAAHELRTPLAATRTMLQVAMAHPQQRDLDDDLGGRLLSANTRSIATTEALLTLATAQHADVRVAVVDIAESSGEVITQLEDEATAHEVTVHSELRSTSIDGDPVLLRQLITNLMLNAIRHNHSGGHVTITTTPTPACDHHGVLTVENTGPLVAPEQVDRLFEAFYRDRGRVGRGHGLGLSIVRAITDAHDGTISATARPEGGLRVTVSL